MPNCLPKAAAAALLAATGGCYYYNHKISQPNTRHHPVCATPNIAHAPSTPPDFPISQAAPLPLSKIPPSAPVTPTTPMSSSESSNTDNAISDASFGAFYGLLFGGLAHQLFATKPESQAEKAKPEKVPAKPAPSLTQSTHVKPNAPTTTPGKPAEPTARPAPTTNQNVSAKPSESSKPATPAVAKPTPTAPPPAVRPAAPAPAVRPAAPAPAVRIAAPSGGGGGGRMR